MRRREGGRKGGCARRCSGLGCRRHGVAAVGAATGSYEELRLGTDLHRTRS